MKWLKPGGIVHIEVPSKHFINKLVNIYYRLIGTNYLLISAMHTPFHLYEFSLSHLRN